LGRRSWPLPRNSQLQYQRLRIRRGHHVPENIYHGRHLHALSQRRDTLPTSPPSIEHSGDPFGNISELLASPESSAPKLQLLSGVISLQITNAWKGIRPSRMHQKLYRTIHKTIILHQHGAWLHRNNALHPDTELPVVVDYGRKRTQKRLTIEKEEVNHRDKEWKRQREAGLLRERMWEGTPLSPSKTNTRRPPFTTQDTTSASSVSSETDD
jgi:hypothetical protein